MICPIFQHLQHFPSDIARIPACILFSIAHTPGVHIDGPPGSFGFFWGLFKQISSREGVYKLLGSLAAARCFSVTTCRENHCSFLRCCKAAWDWMCCGLCHGGWGFDFTLGFVFLLFRRIGWRTSHLFNSLSEAYKNCHLEIHSFFNFFFPLLFLFVCFYFFYFFGVGRVGRVFFCFFLLP